MFPIHLDLILHIFSGAQEQGNPLTFNSPSSSHTCSPRTSYRTQRAPEMFFTMFSVHVNLLMTHKSSGSPYQGTYNPSSPFLPLTPPDPSLSLPNVLHKCSSMFSDDLDLILHTLRVTTARHSLNIQYPISPSHLHTPYP